MTLRYAHLSTAHRLAVVQLLDAPSGGPTGTKPAPDAMPSASAAEEQRAELSELPHELKDEPCWDRTSDPQLKRLLLYQLS